LQRSPYPAPIRDDPVPAARDLQDARAFANRSGNVDLQLRCFHSATELHRRLNDLLQSITDAESGILLADTCGFGKFSIDLRLALAETYLVAGDPHKALQTPAKRETYPRPPTANTPGEKPTASTSAASPTSASTNPS
jgi:hypothetical protein